MYAYKTCHTRLISERWARIILYIVYYFYFEEFRFGAYMIQTLKTKPTQNAFVNLLFIILHMHRFFLNIRWLITYPYNILFRWRNMILALHRKWSHQYAYRWRTMILAIRSWFQVDYCLPYYVSILGCALSDLLSAILLD